VNNHIVWSVTQFPFLMNGLSIWYRTEGLDMFGCSQIADQLPVPSLQPMFFWAQWQLHPIDFSETTKTHIKVSISILKCLKLNILNTTKKMCPIQILYPHNWWLCQETKLNAFFNLNLYQGIWKPNTSFYVPGIYHQHPNNLGPGLFITCIYINNRTVSRNLGKVAQSIGLWTFLASVSPWRSISLNWLAWTDSFMIPFNPKGVMLF
jgi:hypothetical protein